MPSVWHRCIRYERIGYQCPFQNLEEPLWQQPQLGNPRLPKLPNFKLPDFKRPDIDKRDQPDPEKRIHVERSPYNDEFTIDKPRSPGDSTPRIPTRIPIDDVRQPLQPFTPSSSPYSVQLPQPNIAPIIEKYHTLPDGIPVAPFNLSLKNDRDDFGIDDPEDNQNNLTFNFGEQYAQWIQRTLNSRFNTNRSPLQDQLLQPLKDRQQSQANQPFQPSYNSYVLEAQLGEENFVDALSRDSEQAKDTKKTQDTNTSESRRDKTSNIAKSVGAGIAAVGVAAAINKIRGGGGGGLHFPSRPGSTGRYARAY